MLAYAMFLNSTSIPYQLIVLAVAGLLLTVGVVWIWRITHFDDGGGRSSFRSRRGRRR